MSDRLKDYLGGGWHLRQFLYNQVPELLEANDIKAVFALRNWLMSKLCYSSLEFLIPHGDRDTDRMLKALLRHEGGLWCAGAAELFALLLRTVDIPATTYMYGYQGIASLSHVTTIFSIIKRDDQGYAIPIFYLLDAYLGFHYEDPVSHQILELPELLRRIRDHRYGDVERMDEAIERPYITPPGDDPAYRSWLFDDRGIPTAEKNDRTWVYPGATYTIDKLFVSTSPMRHLADARRGDQPLDHFLLDLMFVGPELGRMALSSEGHKDGYTDWMLMRNLVDVMAEGYVG